MLRCTPLLSEFLLPQVDRFAGTVSPGTHVDSEMLHVSSGGVGESVLVSEDAHEIWYALCTCRPLGKRIPGVVGGCCAAACPMVLKQAGLVRPEMDRLLMGHWRR